MSKGRGNSNCIAVNRLLCLNIDTIRKSINFSKIKSAEFEVRWNTGSSAKGRIEQEKQAKILVLKYLYNDNIIENRIEIDSLPSNLNKGCVFYFVCPRTNKRCKNIYFSITQKSFISQKGYGQRLYYQTQIWSKASRTIQRLSRVEDKILSIQNNRRSFSYNGKETKLYSKFKKLEEMRNVLNELKEQEFDEYLRKVLNIEDY